MRSTTKSVVWLFTRPVRVLEIFELLRLPMEGLGAVATTTEIALLVMPFGLGRRLPRKWRRL